MYLKGVSKESEKGELSVAQRWETKPPPPTQLTAPQNPLTYKVLDMLLLYDVFNFIFICTCFSNAYQFYAVSHSK